MSVFRTYVSGLRLIAEGLRLDLEIGVSVVASRNLGCSCWTRKLQALKEPLELEEWQGLKVKRESSARFFKKGLYQFR